MVKTLGLTSLAVMLLLSFNAYSKPLKIFIDPGHGGSDRGAVRGQFVEAQLVLKISKKLKAKLKRDRNFIVRLSRSSNKFLSLQQRKDYVEKVDFDVFLSIHANASIDPRARGVEFYFQNPLEGEEVSSYFANIEQKNHHQIVEKGEMKESDKPDIQTIIDDLKRQNRTWLSQELSRSLFKNWNIPYSRKSSHAVRQAPFFLLNQVEKPTVLVELGYLSNEKEAKRLHRDSYQNKIVKQIYTALKEYKEIVDNSQY